MSHSRKCFCAFCKSPRTVYRKRHVSILDVAWALFASGLASFIFWQNIDPRALLFFVFAVGISELFIVIRWRMSIACKHCGFDPVLYKKKPELAARQVTSHMENRKLDPLSAFRDGPKLPSIIRKTPR